jgi:hypothetical protein
LYKKEALHRLELAERTKSDEQAYFSPQVKQFSFHNEYKDHICVPHWQKYHLPVYITLINGECECRVHRFSLFAV